MQFTATVSDFMKQLAPLAQIVEKKTTLPAIENFLFTMAEGTSELRAWTTNLDCTMETRCPVLSEIMPAPEKRFLAPARRLMEVLRTLPSSASLQIAFDNQEHLHIRCEKTRFRLFSPSADSFPTLPTPLSSTMRIRAGYLSEAIRHTVYAIGEESTRYQLTGAQFVVEFGNDAGKDAGDNDEVAGGFLLAATDGHRLALSRQTETLRVTGKVWQQWQGGDRLPAAVVIPRRTLLDLLPLLETYTREDVDVSFTPEWNFFRIGPYYISSRNLAGMFPRYESIVATCPPNEVIMQTEAVLAAVRRVSILADSITSSISIVLSSNLFTAQSASPQTGEASDSVPIDYTGEGITIGVNSSYLMDTLRTVPTRRFRFCFADANSQFWIMPHPDEDEALATSSRHVIMPLRLS